MPLNFTPYQEQEYLRSKGFSPDDNYIEPETGQIRVKTKEQPVIATPEVVTQQPVVQAKPVVDQPSPFMSGVRSFAKSLIPSSAGAVAGVTAAALAPETGGLSLLAFPLGLAGAFGGAALAEKAQDAVMPKAWEDKLAIDAATNPKASIIGSLAGAAPTFGMSAPNILRAGRTGIRALGNVVGEQIPIEGKEIANALNVGLGGAIGLGGSVGEDLATGKPIDPTKAALSTAGGLLFNKPTKLLNKLTFGKAGVSQPTTPDARLLAEEAQRTGEGLESSATRSRDNAVKAKYLEEEPRSLRSQLIRSEQRGGTPEEIAQRQFDVAETEQRPTSFYSERKTDEKGKESYEIPFGKISKTDKLLMPELIDEKGKLRAGIDEVTFRDKLDEKIHGEKYQQYKNALAEAQNTNAEVNKRVETEQRADKQERDVKVMQNQVEAGIQNRSPVTTTNQRALNKNVNYQHWKKAFEKFKIEGDLSAEKEAKYFEEPGYVERYTTEMHGKPEQPFTAQKVQLKKATKFQGEEGQGLERLQSAKDLEKAAMEGKQDLNPTTGLLKFFQQHIGPLRHIKVEEDGSLVNTITGKPVKGLAVMREGMQAALNKINPFKASLDTLGHEAFHTYGNDLRTSPHEADRRIMSKFDAAVSNSPEFRRINESRQKAGLPAHDVEELGTEGVGIDIARRILNPDNMEGTTKRAWQDFLTRVKIKWGKATPHDYERLLSERFFRDPSYFERFKASDVSVKPTNQETNKEKEKINEPTSKSPDEFTNNENAQSQESGLRTREKEQIQQSIKESGTGPSELTKTSEISPEHQGAIKDEIASGSSAKSAQEISDIKGGGARQLEDSNSARINTQHKDTVAKASELGSGAKSASEEQEKSLIAAPTTPDFEKYQSAQKNLMEKFREHAGDITHPEVKKAWQESENIKKRYTELLQDKSGRYYEGEDQGLNSHEKILEDLNRVAKAPEFQKANVFKRGLNELVTSRLPVFGSDISKLEARNGAEGKMISPALREYFAKELNFEGKYLNPSTELLKNLTDKQLDNLYSVMLQEKKTQQFHPDELIDSQTHEVYEKYRALIKQKQEDQIAAKQPVQELDKDGKIGYRLPRINPYYVPEIVGGKQLDILLNAKGSEAFNNLKRDFITYQKKAYDINDHAAGRMFDDLLSSYGGPTKGDSTHFGAVRLSEGVGLPTSWLERDFATAMRRYWRRVAKDRAFYDSIESDNNLLHIIDRKHDAWGKDVKADENVHSLAGNETLDNIMDIIQGHAIKANPVIDAFSRIASNLVLGPATGVVDLINAAPILAKFIPSPAHIPGYLKSILNIKQGIRDAVGTGRIKENTTAIGDVTYPRGDFVEKLRDIGNMVSKVNTREYLERYSRGVSQALSTYLVDVHKGLAETGNEKSQALLTGLANGKDYKKIDDKELASRLLEFGQGTYDPRGLPSWAIDSQIAPLFRLAKWNIEQLNTLHKHVLLPLKQGNFTPLLMTLGGGLIGGYLAKEVREKMNNKKQPIPEWAEIINSSRGLKGNIPAATYNLAAAISYSGITGLFGDVVKSGFDVAFKNTPQGMNYPLAEVVGDTAVKLAQAADAIFDGENPLKVIPKLLSDMVSTHIQVGRMAKNQLSNFNPQQKQLTKDAESRRNLRVYKMVEGEPFAPQGLQSAAENPYVGLDAKSFKQRGITELPEAMKEAGELTKKTLETSKPSELLKNFSSLKRNNFQTLPSPQSNPIEFARFVNYNNRVRGVTDTKERVKRYFEQSMANQVKAKFIP